jgi:hypothetical protein
MRKRDIFASGTLYGIAMEFMTLGSFFTNVPPPDKSLILMILGMVLFAFVAGIDAEKFKEYKK